MITDEALWCWVNADCEAAGSTFSNPDKAVQDYLKTYPNEHPNEIWLGHPRYYHPEVDAVNVIERIQQEALDETGDYAESYLDAASTQHVTELGDELTKVFRKWESFHNYGLGYIVKREVRYIRRENGKFERV